METATLAALLFFKFFTVFPGDILNNQKGLDGEGCRRGFAIACYLQGHELWKAENRRIQELCLSSQCPADYVVVPPIIAAIDYTGLVAFDPYEVAIASKIRKLSFSKVLNDQENSVIVSRKYINYFAMSCSQGFLQGCGRLYGHIRQTGRPIAAEGVLIATYPERKAAYVCAKLHDYKACNIYRSDASIRNPAAHIFSYATYRYQVATLKGRLIIEWVERYGIPSFKELPSSIMKKWSAKNPRAGFYSY